METQNRWIELDGAVNVRDLGGLETTDGRTTRFGRVLRSDNLQSLSPSDLDVLVGRLGLRNVIDLRSHAEVELEGPGPLTERPEVTIHHLTLFAEAGHFTDVAAETVDGPAGIDADKVLPWQTGQDTGPETDWSVEHYLGYLRDRPNAIVKALRVMSTAGGAALVHCAAGKDRTGVVCALALDAVGVAREATVADYAQTGERIAQILARLRSSPTYAEDIDSRPADSHTPHAYIMDKFLSRLDEMCGGSLGWLGLHGWTDQDTRSLQEMFLE